MRQNSRIFQKRTSGSGLPIDCSRRRGANFAQQRQKRLDGAGPPTASRVLRDAFTSVYRGPQSISCECLCIAATRTHQVEVRTSSQELSDKAETNESTKFRGDY